MAEKAEVVLGSRSHLLGLNTRQAKQLCVDLKLKPKSDSPQQVMLALFDHYQGPEQLSGKTLATQLEEMNSKLEAIQAALENVTASATQAAVEKVLEVVQIKQDAQVAAELSKEMKESLEGWKTVNHHVRRDVAQMADAERRSKKGCNVRLTRFEALEGETSEELHERVCQTVLVNTLGLKMEEVKVATVQRFASRDKKKTYANAAGSPTPGAITITLETPEMRNKVLRAKKRLAGKPWGLDEDLTPQQQAQRKAGWTAFKEAKEAGLPAYWKGGDLYVEHRLHPVIPTS